MNGKDAIRLQYSLFYRTAKGNLDGISAEQSVAQPAPGGNCTNWIVAHLINAHNGAMALMGADPIYQDERLETISTDPITSAENAFDWDTIRDSLLGSEEAFMAAFDALTEDQLDEDGFTDPFGNPSTRGQVLNLLAFHQNYHAGQLGISRRLAGLPGAIAAPAAAGAET